MRIPAFDPPLQPSTLRAYDIMCPVCSSPVNRKCRSPKGQPMQWRLPHQARRIAAAEAAKNA